MNRSAAVALLATPVILLGAIALADRPIGTALSSGAVIRHGDWMRLTDAGFRYTVCGFTTLSDGTRIYTFPSLDGGEEIGPCETCNPGGWNAAPATCSAQWKANRGL